MIEGGAGADRLYGDLDADLVYGGDGADVMGGGQGNDALRGGGDNDTISGDEGTDQVAGDGGNDLIYGGDGTDMLAGGLGDDTMNGGAGADAIYGQEGNDSLSGGEGTDLILGGAGRDLIQLWESVASADVILFLAGDSGRTLATIDRVEGFDTARDRIDLRSFGAMTFEDIDFSGAGASCYYDGRFLRIDTNGDRAVDMMVEFAWVAELQADDLMLA